MTTPPSPGEKPKGRLSLRTLTMPADTNPNGQIFGGWLMSQMDMAGGNHAHFRARGRVVTVAVESVKFLLPVEVGDELTCYTDIVKVGNTSLGIRVEAWTRKRYGDHQKIRVTDAVFTYVAVDEHGKKRPVPEWTEEE